MNDFTVLVDAPAVPTTSDDLKYTVADIAFEVSAPCALVDAVAERIGIYESAQFGEDTGETFLFNKCGFDLMCAEVRRAR